MLVRVDAPRRKIAIELCQNCVRQALKPRENAVTYGDTSTHIDVAGSR